MYEKCRRCRRALTNPESRKIGFGKVCARKSGVTGLDPENVEASAGEVMLVPPLSRPFTGDVVLMRYRDEARANIPHTVILHSPTGFEWGYGGSGAEYSQCLYPAKARHIATRELLQWHVL